MAIQGENSPRFFRIILSSVLQDGVLELPRSFVMDHGERLSNHARLKVRSGVESKIGLKKCNGQAWLCQGWRDFVDKYSIKCGYFLIFTYEGGSLFNVMIFDLSTVEIDYADECAHGDKVRRMNFANNRGKLKSGQPLSGIQNKSLGRDRLVSKRKQLGTSSAKERVLERAKAFQSPYPHFLVTMYPAYKSCLYVPVGPIASHLLKKGNNSISLRGADTSTWSIGYTTGTPLRPRIRFCSGWTSFWEDNHLHEGDVCAFALVNASAPITLKVTIFRITDNDEEEEGEEEIDEKETGMLHQARRNKGVSSDPEARVLQRVESFKTKNPHFSVRMTRFYLSRKAKVHIPSAHARRYIKGDGKDIILHGSNGRTWPVKCHHFIRNSGSMRYPRVYISGWKDFASENRLRVGDYCVFEKMNGKAKAYKVTIFHIADHA